MSARCSFSVSCTSALDLDSDLSFSSTVSAARPRSSKSFLDEEDDDEEEEEDARRPPPVDAAEETLQNQIYFQLILILC